MRCSQFTHDHAGLASSFDLAVVGVEGGGARLLYPNAEIVVEFREDAYVEVGVVSVGFYGVEIVADLLDCAVQ